MYMLNVLLLVFILALQEGLGSGRRSPKNKVLLQDYLDQLPEFDANEKIQLYYLRSKQVPVVDSMGMKFMGQTSGIALSRWTNTHGRPESTVVVLQFMPRDISSCYIPILQGEGKNVKLYWNKDSAIFWSDNIDTNYWKSSTYMAEINGVVYSQYMTWVMSYVKDRKITFMPQRICDGVDMSVCYVMEANGDTFSEDTFNRLASLAVDLRPLIAPMMTGILLTAESRPRDLYSDGSMLGSNADGQLMVIYYTNLLECLRNLSLTITSFPSALSLCHKKGDDVYVHIADNHYMAYKSYNSPMAQVIEREQVVPQPRDILAPGTSLADMVIAWCILSIAIIGFMACCMKLHLPQYFYGRLVNTRGRSMSAIPTEGGYSQASELPTYVEWSWLSPTSSMKRSATSVAKTSGSANGRGTPISSPMQYDRLHFDED